VTLRLAVLRPEPGHAATLARAQAAGFETVSLPLFAVQALAWDVPSAAAFDALILTSANAVRFAGARLADLTALPVLAVGPHTAAAAREAGFDVMATGGGDGAEIAALAVAQGVSRALHLTGRDRTLTAGGLIARVIPVYESAALAIDPVRLRDLIGSTALLHSARAARRLAELIDAAKIARARIAIAAFSPAIAAAAGSGWAGIASAATPDDGALFAAARSIADTRGR
jgi:uroporphyrinogen-III synthase